MGASYSESSGKRYLTLNSKHSMPDGSTKPMFVEKKKVGDTYEVSQVFNKFEGQLMKIEETSYKWNEKVIDQIEMTFKDGDENWILSFNKDNGITRSIINAMAGADIINMVSFSLYMKNDYPTVYMEIDGKKSGWKYQANEFPKAEPIIHKGKEVGKDNEAQLKFFDNLLRKDVMPKINSKDFSSNPVSSPTPYPAQEPVKSMVSGGNGMTEDEIGKLPF